MTPRQTPVMKKPKVKYTLIILLSLLCLLVTIYALQSPMEMLPESGGVGNVSDSLDQAVGMLGERLRWQARP